MDRKQIISTIFIATIIGMLFGLVVRLKREKIPFKMYFYVSMVLITDIFIYPLFFPLFFKKKVYALYKSNEIIGKLKEHNINTKKINRKKLEKEIYEQLNIKKVISLWINTLKNSYSNIDLSIDNKITEIKNTKTFKIYEKIGENNQTIKESKKKINEIKKSIRRNKRIILRNKFTILWFKIIINILEFMLSFKGMHNVLKISIINSQIEIDNSTQFDALKRAY